MSPKTKKTTSKQQKKGTKAAMKDDFEGLDELLNDAQQIAAIERQQLEEERLKQVQAQAMRAHSGMENARIGMAGFSRATQDPSMFADAMGMLSDPEAVKEAEKMMHDPEFKTEISRYMQQLKSDPSFSRAMQEAQKKFQELMQDPEKLAQLQQQYAGTLGAMMPGAGTVALGKEGGEEEGGAATAAAGEAGEDGEAAEVPAAEAPAAAEAPKEPAKEAAKGAPVAAPLEQPVVD